MADQENSAQAESKRISFTIQNILFDAAAPYAEGHVLSAQEAAVLNQTRVENLRNNFASSIKEKLAAMAKEEPPRTELGQEEIDELRSAFAEYEQGYEFQGKRSPRSPVDPVAREANKMAKETINAALKARNIDAKNLVEGRFESLIKEYLEKNPQVIEEARARVQAVKALAADALDGVDLTGATKAESGEPEAEAA